MCLTEQTARHNGHLDVLRELVGGFSPTERGLSRPMSLPVVEPPRPPRPRRAASVFAAPPANVAEPVPAPRNGRVYRPGRDELVRSYGFPAGRRAGEDSR